MTTEQLQHLGSLLTSGEDNALLARELMIGQGIWNAQGVCDCLNVVQLNMRKIDDRFSVPSAFLADNFHPYSIRYPNKSEPYFRPTTPAEKDDYQKQALMMLQYTRVEIA